MAQLSARKVQTVSEPGMYNDGEGLYLRVGPSGGKSWILRTVVHGKRRDFGLGSASLISLAEAREKAGVLRKVARGGGDPAAIRSKEQLTVEEAARRVHAELMPTWRNKKHSETWLASVAIYALPIIGDRPVHTIGTADVLRVLQPIWTSKHETAKRLKQRLATIFDWAKGHGHYPHENPVNGVKKALPNVKHKAVHMSALHWQEVPALMSELAERDGVSARCLEFITLSATRSGEARGARWSEIEGDVWTVPADRMKRGIEHRVPLSKAALEVLDRVKGLDPIYVFPSPQLGPNGQTRPMSDMVFTGLLKRMSWAGRFTPHGLRSSFRDWCSESARVDRDVAEAALSHASGSQVERAYARSDLFERRRELMEAWGRYVTGGMGNVVKMVR